MKTKTPRDGWSGKLFRSLRVERGRSVEFVSVKTGVLANQVRKYESDVVFPSHSWRDAAALALGLNRRDLGAEGG